MQKYGSFILTLMFVFVVSPRQVHASEYVSGFAVFEKTKQNILDIGLLAILNDKLVMTVVDAATKRRYYLDYPNQDRATSVSRFVRDCIFWHRDCASGTHSGIHPELKRIPEDKDGDIYRYGYVFRLALFSVLRSYLAQPENLDKIYKMRKGVLVKAIRAKSKSEQVHIQKLIRDTRNSFIEFLGNVSTRKIPEIKCDPRWKHSCLSWEQKVMRDKKVSDYLGKTVAHVSHLPLYKFAERRWKEGGIPLLRRYISILNDLEIAIQ